MGTVVDSRAERWSAVSAVTSGSAAASTSEGTALAARARHLAGSAALQARLADVRAREAQARLRLIAAAGAAAATASLGCAAVAGIPAFAPDLVVPLLGSAAAGAAVLLGLLPATLLVATALGWRNFGDRSATTTTPATTLATLSADIGRAIEAIEADAHPEVVRAVGVVLGVLEAEADTAARSARPQPGAAPARRHQRIVPIERRIVVRTADGRNLIGTIADVSLSGAALTACLPRVALGEAALVGSRPAVVARLWERGIAFQFEQELDPATFDETIIL